MLVVENEHYPDIKQSAFKVFSHLQSSVVATEYLISCLRKVN